MPLTNPPVGAVLLKRTTRPALPSEGGQDYVKPTERWYDPAVRTAATYEPGITTDTTVYSRPTADVIDRYCDNPGVAPFREFQVHHNGTGDVVFTPVDGVAVCQISCTIGVTLTASAIANGRADLTATVTGAVGAVLLSLDGFYTDGISALATVFRDGRAGFSYTVTARETRPGGCTATATLRLLAPYGPRFELPFYDLYNTPCLLTIYEREYAGTASQLEAEPDAVVLDWPGPGPTGHVYDQLLRGSECGLSLLVLNDDQLAPLFSGDERLHRVEYRRAGQLAWIGYLLPEQYDAAFLDPPYSFALHATDGIGALSTVPFTGSRGEPLTGDWSLLRVVRHCLERTGLALPLHVLFSLYPAGATLAAAAIEQVYVDAGQFADEDGKPFDCGKVLADVLTTFGCRLMQTGAAWRLERLSELRIEALTYAVYAATGERVADTTRTLLLATQAPAAGVPFWLNANQRQGLRPAVATVTVKTDPGRVVNVLAPLLPTNAHLPAAAPRRWKARPLPGDPLSQLLYAGKDETPTLRLFGTKAMASTPEQAGYLELPLITPLPLITIFEAHLVDECQGLQLSFTATPYGHTPNTDITFCSKMYVSLSFGDEALSSYGVGVVGLATVTKVVMAPVVFNGPAAVKVFLPWSQDSFARGPRAPRPITLRLYAPVGGLTACRVDITDLRLEWKSAPMYTSAVDPADFFTSRYTGQTGQLVSRVDDALALPLTDTPYVRRSVTLLGPDFTPTAGWFEPDALGQFREAGDYLVRDRLLMQAAPAQVLTGTLRRAAGLGPGALLTDPTERAPGVYLLTGYTAHEADDTADVTAVQLLPLVAPLVALPDGAIYFEDLYAWQAEDGRILVYEDA